MLLCRTGRTGPLAEPLGFRPLDYNGRVGTHASQRVPVVGCNPQRRLRDARPAVCTVRDATVGRRCANSASVGGALSAPRGAEPTVCVAVTIRVNASQGRPERASRIASSSVMAMVLPGACLDAVRRQCHLCWPDNRQSAPAWRYAAGVSTMARRSGGPRSKKLRPGTILRVPSSAIATG